MESTLSPRNRFWRVVTPVIAIILAALPQSAPSQNRDHHGPANIDAYIEHLLRPERVAFLQPELVIASLDLPDSAVVGDLGTGPGVFAIPLGLHLPHGLVYAVDVEPRQLDALSARLEAEHVRNVIPVLASHSDPHLPLGRLDLVLVVDTYHHIENRIDYFRRLRATFRDGGRLAILEYKPGDLPVGPPAQEKIPPDVRESELRSAGYTLIRRFDTHRYHDFEVWSATPAH